MKQVLFSIVGIFILFMLPSCVKPENRFVYTIKGRIMSYMTNEGKPQVNLSLKARNFGYGAKWSIIASAYTNEQGVFFLEQVPLRHHKELRLEPVRMNINNDRSKKGDTVDLGDIWVNE